MNNYKVGLQITRNTKKYNYLLSLLSSHLVTPKKFDFFRISDNDNLKKIIKSLDILVTYKISKKEFSPSNGKLKWIHLGASGIEQSLFPSILKSKTIITNARGIHADSVSEFVIAMILYLSKQFKGCEKFKETKEWTQWELAKNTIQLKNKTIGIIGYGKIGKAIAKKTRHLICK